jgi:hypothetical protein
MVLPFWKASIVCRQKKCTKFISFNIVYFTFSYVVCVPLCYPKIQGTIIVPVVLYGCKTWSLTLREENRLRICENRVLRRIFGPKRDEVTVEWRRLHTGERHALNSLPNIICVIKSRRLRWAGHVARMGRGGVH